MKIFFLFILSFSSIFCALEAYIYQDPTPVEQFLKPVQLNQKKSNFKYIDCIYVINLDRRPEKWLRTQELMQKYGFRPNRFSAIDGWKISTEEKEILFGNYPVRLCPGEIGCLLSHLSVIRDGYLRGFNIIWVCEDDIEFIEDPHQLSHFIEKLNKIDPDWDILYTDIDSRNSKGEPVPSLSQDFRPDRMNEIPLSYFLKRNFVTKKIMKIGQRFGMYSLFISKKGMQKIYDYFTHVYLWAQVDVDIHYIPGLREYSSTRDIVSVWVDSPYSDTNPDR